MRSTGVGWALGVGRVGGILGPILVGAALTLNWSPSAVFYAMAVPMLAAASRWPCSACATAPHDRVPTGPTRRRTRKRRRSATALPGRGPGPSV
ncbi:hypothetical protein ACFQV4_23165 [Streptomyces thermocarboxydus]